MRLEHSWLQEVEVGECLGRGVAEEVFLASTNEALRIDVFHYVQGDGLAF